MDGELRKFEEELERLSPAGMPDGMIARMEAAMAGWENAASGAEATAEKVVPFPQATEPVRTNESNRGFWAAAAAVALLGAVVALVLPDQSPAGNEVASSSPDPEFAAVAFEPTNLDRNIVQASDGGLVFTNDDRPHRVVRVEYLDRFEFRNAAGDELHVEKPSVKVVLIPVRTD